MAYCIDDDEPIEKATSLDELMVKALTSGAGQKIVEQLLSSTLDEANGRLEKQIASLGQRLDRVMLRLAPVRLAIGHRHHS